MLQPVVSLLENLPPNAQWTALRRRICYQPRSSFSCSVQGHGEYLNSFPEHRQQSICNTAVFTANPYPSMPRWQSFGP